MAELTDATIAPYCHDLPLPCASTAAAKLGSSSSSGGDSSSGSDNGVKATSSPSSTSLQDITDSKSDSNCIQESDLDRMMVSVFFVFAIVYYTSKSLSLTFVLSLILCICTILYFIFNYQKLLTNRLNLINCIAQDLLARWEDSTPRSWQYILSFVRSHSASPTQL